MAFTHGINATLSLGAVTLTGYITNANIDLRRELSDLNLIGESSVRRVPGLADVTVNTDGAVDTSVLSSLLALYTSGSSVAVSFSPDGGSNTFTFDAYIESFTVNASSNNAATFSISLRGDGDVTVA